MAQFLETSHLKPYCICLTLSSIVNDCCTDDSHLPLKILSTRILVCKQTPIVLIKLMKDFPVNVARAVVII